MEVFWWCMWYISPFSWSSVISFINCFNFQQSVCLQCGRPGFDPWVRKIPWRRKWQPTPVFLPGEPHGQRSLVDCSPRVAESDTTERLHFHFHFHQLIASYKWCSKLPWSYFPGAQMVKHLPTMRGTQVRSLGWEDPLEKEIATQASTLAWKIPWTEEHGRLQSMGSQRVRHDWATSLSLSLFEEH